MVAIKKRKKNKERLSAKIKVIGVGGAGNNAVSRMCENFSRNIDLISINTDVQDLNQSNSRKKIHIGENSTKGLGAGMNPDLGRQAAEENRLEITEILKGADMVFITAGFGGGTGTGATPIIAEIARELGILTIAIITKPFSFEGTQRARIAQEGLVKLKDRVDTLIVIPNDRIFSIINKDTSLLKAFEAIDEILKNAVLGVTELIMSSGIVNIDFADVKTVMADAGSAIIGVGIAGGQERSVKAAKQAINSPLLETSIEGAKGVLFSISGHKDLKMQEIHEIANLISENVDQSAKIIFGAYHDRKLNKGQLKITLIATGFNGDFGSKNGILLPSLFPTSQIDDRVSELITKEENVLKTDDDIKTKKKEKNKEKESEEIWDIPAFLRKKRR